jgi:hypothetical protein
VFFYFTAHKEKVNPYSTASALKPVACKVVILSLKSELPFMVLIPPVLLAIL